MNLMQGRQPRKMDANCLRLKCQTMVNAEGYVEGSDRVGAKELREEAVILVLEGESPVS